jgi:hypothetical protein
MTGKRFMVVFINRDGKEETTWSKEYDTLTEAHQAIFDTRSKATGYAIFDREFQNLIKSKNFAFDDHEMENFDPSTSF